MAGFNHVLMSESALDSALVMGGFSEETLLPNLGGDVFQVALDDGTTGFRVSSEPRTAHFALIKFDRIRELNEGGANLSDIFRRIARVVKGLKSPPVHLPRQWSEFHHRNLLAFFAVSRDIANVRWIAELDGENRCAHFGFLSSDSAEVDLTRYQSQLWPVDVPTLIERLLASRVDLERPTAHKSLAEEVDLQVIGSASIVIGRTYEEWQRHLAQEQLAILQNPIGTSIRIVGPAGSGKTLSLCLRALQISRDESVIKQGKRILVATHSWAMSERIDGTLTTLNGGAPPDGITVFPLLSLLELHAGHIGRQRTELIGDDSTDGRVKSLEIILNLLSRYDRNSRGAVSKWIDDALASSDDSRASLDLATNLYEEISGVLSASGVSPDDPDSIQEYIGGTREEWMPPFITIADRSFVISIYRGFMENLIDRSAITTDQFVLDSIRVLETFTWRMRKETEGYDYIFVDELQLFDPQERSALELLGRSRRGVPFITAEDPLQAVFSALNGRKTTVENAPTYLNTVHRFNREIFDLINFIYQRFPLNALPLQITSAKTASNVRPTLFNYGLKAGAISHGASLAKRLYDGANSDERVCLVTLGDVDVELVASLDALKLPVTQLKSFDDVEQLAYSRRSIVVSPWQFIGGTQFAHVVVMAIGIDENSSQFGRLREMTTVYLASSRAVETLQIVCGNYTPRILAEAGDHGLLDMIAS